MSTFGQKLKALREHMELSQELLGKKLGTSKQVISRYETEINSPRIDTVDLMSKFFNIDISFLINPDFTVNDVIAQYEQKSAIAPTLKRIIDTSKRLNTTGQIKVADYADDLDKSGQYPLSFDDGAEFYDKDVTLVKPVAKAAAGNGAYYYPHEDFGVKRVTSEDVPKYDDAIIIAGHSMEPTIDDGDVAFVVHNYDKRDGDIYAVSIDNDVVIKRVYFDDNHITLVSDNPDFKDRTISQYDNAHISGRVVGWATPER